MILTLMIVAGVVALMVLAVCIGASMDTESQRREWQRVAAERRRLREELLYGPEVGVGAGPEVGLDVGEYDDSWLCDRCPFRRAAGY